MTQPIEKAEFVGLLTAHQRRLFGYIATLLPNPADAEEVLQQTNTVLWTKADDFQSGTSFRAWSFRIAQLEVIAFHRKHAREKRLFSGELLEVMASEICSPKREQADRTAQALRTCLDKLSTTDRDLVTRRYHAGAMVDRVSQDLGRAASSIYRSLERIRFVLLECIQRTIASEERP